MYGSITQFKGHLTFKGLYLEIELTLLFIENVYSNLLLIRKKKAACHYTLQNCINK